MRNFPLGLAAVLLAIGFNLPFALLAAQFDYPDILRHPPGEVLDAFAAGGPGLILTWYAFALAAVALMLFAPALALTTADWRTRPGLAVGAALTGSLAGLTQAVGLMRWVFAVPALAAAHADPTTGAATRDALETGFVLLNQWGGVAIGEHLGQMLTVVWMALAARQSLALGQRFSRLAAVLAAGGVAGIGIGLADGLALALGLSIPIFSIATVAGYLALSLWLLVLAAGLVAHPFFPARQPL